MPSRGRSRTRDSLKPPYDDEELAGIIGNMITTAGDYAQDFLEDNRRQAWYYYLGRRSTEQDYTSTTPREGYEREGASHAVSEDVADMVEALTAVIVPMFSSDVPVQFEPVAEGDEENAAAESDAVANVLMERNQGWTILTEAVKDALLLRNGTIKCWIEERVTTERKRFKDITDDQLAQVLAAAPEGIEVSITSRNGKRAQLQYITRTREPRVKCIEQSNFFIDPNHSSIFIQEVHFCAERKFPSRSDLLLEGYDSKVVDDLPAFTQDTDIDSTAKNIEGISADLQRPTHDADLIETYECYMRIDMTGDGESELMRFIWSNEHLLDQQPFDFIPYATGTAWLVPHRYSGMSVYDKIRQVTDIKSRALQQYLDNLTTNNTARTGVDENTVNVDDLLAGRPNAVIRVDGRPADSMMPFPTNDTGQSSQSLLNYMDTIRDQRAGAALSLQQPNEQMNLKNITAASADRQMSASEQQASMIARTLAETLIRSTFLLLHETLRTQFPEEIMLNRSGQWIPVSPSDWPHRDRVNVKIGLSPAERSRKAASLQQTIMQQMQLMQAGGNGIIVGLNEIHRASLDWGRSVELDNPEKYWIDPESEKSQQAAAAAQKQQQEQQQAQLQAVTAEAQAQGLNAQLDRMSDQEKLQFEYFKVLLETELDEQELTDKREQARSGANGSTGESSGESEG